MPPYDLPSVRGDFPADLQNVIDQYRQSRVWDLAKLGWQNGTSPTQLAAIFNQAAAEAAVDGGVIIFPAGGRWTVDPLVVPRMSNSQEPLIIYGRGAHLQLSAAYRGSNFSGLDTYQGRHWTIRFGHRTGAGSFYQVYDLHTTGRIGGANDRYETNGMWLGANNQCIFMHCRADYHDGCGFMFTRAYNLRFDVRCFGSGTWEGNNPFAAVNPGEPIHAIQIPCENGDTVATDNSNDWQGRAEVERCPFGIGVFNSVNGEMFVKLHGTPAGGQGTIPECQNGLWLNRCSTTKIGGWITQSYAQTPILVQDNPTPRGWTSGDPGSQDVPGQSFIGNLGFDQSQVELNFQGMENVRLLGNTGRTRALIECSLLEPGSLVTINGDCRRYITSNTTDVCGIVKATGVGEVDLRGLTVASTGVEDDLSDYVAFIDERDASVQGKVRARGTALGMEGGLPPFRVQIVATGTALTTGTKGLVKLPPEFAGKRITKIEAISGAAPSGGTIELRVRKHRPDGAGGHDVDILMPYNSWHIEDGETRSVAMQTYPLNTAGQPNITALDFIEFDVDGIPPNAADPEFTGPEMGGLWGLVYVA